MVIQARTLRDMIPYWKSIFYHLLPTSMVLAYRFMLNNAHIHSCRYMDDCFCRLDMSVFPWQACSPDLNPIENVWGHMARAVYESCREYDTISSLIKKGSSGVIRDRYRNWVAHHLAANEVHLCSKTVGYKIFCWNTLGGMFSSYATLKPHKFT